MRDLADSTRTVAAPNMTTPAAPVTQACAHPVFGYGKCARCGLPICSECTPPRVTLESIGLRLPLACCSRCTADLEAIAALASDEAAAAACCPAHADGATSAGSPADASHTTGTCSACKLARVIARYRNTRRALALLSAERFHGEGERRTHELDLELTKFTIEAVALPGKPFCVVIKPFDESEVRRMLCLIVDTG